MSPTRARWPCCCPAPTSTTPPRWRCPGCVTALRHPETRAPGPLAVLAPEAWPAALGEASLALWRHTLDQLAAAGHTPQTWTPPPGLSFDRMAEDNSLVLAYEAYRYYGALAEDPAQPLWTVVRAHRGRRPHPPGRLRSRPCNAATPTWPPTPAPCRATTRCSCPPATRPPNRWTPPTCATPAWALLRPAISARRRFRCRRGLMGGMPIGVQLLAPAGRMRR